MVDVIPSKRAQIITIKIAIVTKEVYTLIPEVNNKCEMFTSSPISCL